MDATIGVCPLPLEICERIIDFVASFVKFDDLGDVIPDRSSLVPCALVCRAWLPRCRFLLSPDGVILHSRREVVSFSLFMHAFPPAASGLGNINIFGPWKEGGDTSTADSWVSSVPAILPPLPDLRYVNIHDIHLAHQHTTLYKLYSAFDLAELSLHRVSFHHFSQVARLAVATGAPILAMFYCPRSLPMSNSTGLGRLLPRNVFLRALPVLCSSGVSTVTIVASAIDWLWEDHIPEKWKPVDDALSQYYPFLTHLKLECPDRIPYHDVFTPQYGCVENLTRTLFPRTVQRATVEGKCVDDDCGIHRSIEWLLIEIIDIQLPEQIPDTRPRLPIPRYPSPPLPIEICEMILDFVAWSKKSSWDDPDLDRPALTRCALVCRAWLPRCRFQLRPDAVDLSSGSDAASLSRFYAAVPDAASTLKFLEIHGRKRGDTSTADSWVYSVPAILPPLPNLILLNFYDVDLAHQHPALYKLYSAFSISKPALHLSRVSIHDFSQVARLALATQTRGLDIGDCPPVSIDTLSPLLPRMLQALPLICSGDFPTVIIEIHLGPNWTWEDFTPETWKPIDNAPLHYYRSLTHFNVDIVARATIERMCVDDDCSIHNAVRA
ncbi:hypothetical protein EUX98_g6051 [Antrodiella citrinella]|uniref:F-box domain-containing protein n=1 Tax=Antrodiella citrinella TaxID=2447956 RepID=A0A4S4MS47_9APHY|nr:hypothetical protein EUX98_g6051 [Antrodiella citrinella]